MAGIPIHLHWGEGDDLRLRDLASQGMSYSAIGAIIGRTRNACIGRAHRLGVISAQVKPVKQSAPAVVKRARLVRRIMREAAAPDLLQQEQLLAPPAPRYEQPEASTTAFGKPRGLMDLEPRHCRWPLTADDGSTVFCCADRAGGGSWCAEHRLVGFVQRDGRSVKFKLERLYR